MLDKIEDKLKKFYLMLLILGIIVFQYVVPAVQSSAKYDSIEKIIVNHETRISNLENGYINNRELLMEIRFNLKQYIRQSGGEYIEGIESDINKR